MCGEIHNPFLFGLSNLTTQSDLTQQCHHSLRYNLWDKESLVLGYAPESPMDQLGPTPAQ